MRVVCEGGMMKRMRSIPHSPRPEYCVLPVQAVRCELAGINPAGKSPLSYRHPCVLSSIPALLCKQVVVHGRREQCRN